MSRSAPSSSPGAQTQAARKRWIGLTARPRGHFVVDAGARRALETGHEEPARDRRRRGRRRVREGRRRRHPRRRGPRVRPRPDQLRDRRRPPDPRPPDRAGPPGPRHRALRRGHPPGQPGPHALNPLSSPPRALHSRIAHRHGCEDRSKQREKERGKRPEGKSRKTKARGKKAGEQASKGRAVGLSPFSSLCPLPFVLFPLGLPAGAGTHRMLSTQE